MIEGSSLIRREYGLDYFSLVHDMHTIDRTKVAAFCEAIRKSGERFTWGCSARTDCVDDELLGLMASRLPRHFSASRRARSDCSV